MLAKLDIHLYKGVLLFICGNSAKSLLASEDWGWLRDSRKKHISLKGLTGSMILIVYPLGMQVCAENTVQSTTGIIRVCPDSALSKQFGEHLFFLYIINELCTMSKHIYWPLIRCTENKATTIVWWVNLDWMQTPASIHFFPLSSQQNRRKQDGNACGLRYRREDRSSVTTTDEIDLTWGKLI